MSNVKLDSKHNSDAMSLPQLQQLTHTRSERGYLADQAADARIAMVRTLQDMNTTLIQVVDVRSCTRRHPWLVTGSAVAAGFVTGTLLTPSAPTSIKHTGSNSEALSQPGCEGREAPTPGKSVLFSIAGTVLASILQSVVQGSIARVCRNAEGSPEGETASSSCCSESFRDGRPCRHGDS